MNDAPLPLDAPAAPTSPVSPWSRTPHPVAAWAAQAWVTEVERQGDGNWCGLYGVLIVRDGVSVRVLRAAPPAVSAVLGLNALHLPDALPTHSGTSICRSAVFARGEPPELDACPTARLYAHALEQGWVPLASTEIWFDGPEADGLRHHGVCYPACRGRCRPLIRAMLGEAHCDALDAASLTLPDATPLPVVFEDEHVIVVDKPSGMLSVPGLTATPDAQTQLQADVDARIRAAHRLDQATSGLLALAKTPGALRFLQRMFADRRVGKTYEALLEGVPQGDTGTVSLPLAMDPLDRPRQRVCSDGGKASTTHWRLLSQDGMSARVEFTPETGRTHQLRIHAAHRAGLGVPIVGDELYGQAGARLCLHARDLVLPRLNDPAPQYLTAAVPF